MPYPTPLFDAAGTMTGAVNMLDLTERNRAVQIAQHLASVVENSDDAILTKSLDGIITSWNKAAERLFGYTAEETVSKPVTMLIPPERHDEEPVILQRLRRGTHRPLRDCPPSQGRRADRYLADGLPFA